MTKFRLSASILSFLLAFSILGCTAKNSEISTESPVFIPENVNIWQKYDEPVDLNLCVPASDITWPGAVTGDYSYENNVWTRAWKEDLGINAKVKWEALDATGSYETRLNLAIVSGDLPDIIVTKTFSQFSKLQAAGKLQDIAPYMDAYGSDLFKSNLKKSPDKTTNTVIGNKLYGLSLGGNDYRTRLIYIRNDWMKKLGLSAPKSMDDVINIGKKFVDAGLAKYALPLYGQVINGMGDIVAVANSMGAYPRIWIEDGKGNLKYGSIQPEIRDTLKLYSDLVRGGYVDKAFSSINSGTLASQITMGYIGVLPSDYWMISWPLNSMWGDADEKWQKQVDWEIYPVMPMSTLKDEMKIQGGQTSSGVVCVNKDYKNPEVLFKVINFALQKLENPKTAELSVFHSKTMDDKTYQFFNMSPLYLMFNDPMENYDTQKNVTAAIDNGFDKSYLKTAHDKLQYTPIREMFLGKESGIKMSTTQWVAYKSFYGSSSAFAIYNDYISKNMYQFDKITGYQSSTMTRVWSSMLDEEDRAFMKIMSGKEPIEFFDSFVAQWRAMGGDQITNEINEWYKAKS
ncbi:MAG: extracellular solute-binding protein [Oscillospiraceae bacterium]